METPNGKLALWFLALGTLNMFSTVLNIVVEQYWMFGISLFASVFCFFLSWVHYKHI